MNKPPFFNGERLELEVVHTHFYSVIYDKMEGHNFPQSLPRHIGCRTWSLFSYIRDCRNLGRVARQVHVEQVREVVHSSRRVDFVSDRSGH